MKELSIKRCLSKDTLIKAINLQGVVFGLHAKEEEFIVTDYNNPDIIYAVISMGLIIPKI